MKLMEWLYRSPVGHTMSSVARTMFGFMRPRMIYGYKDQVSGSFRKYTRVSTTAVIMSPEKLAMADHVWIGHHTIVDATEGLILEEGCQLSAGVSVYTHSSENAIRYLGRQFVNVHHSLRSGYKRGKVRIGPYTFVGAGSVILPGVHVGRGCLVGAMSLVNHDVDDYSLVYGNPVKKVGDTRDLDASNYNAIDAACYYDEDALRYIQESMKREHPG